VRRKEFLHRLVGSVRVTDDHLGSHLDDISYALLHLWGQARDVA
jgi:hypothetical protein